MSLTPSDNEEENQIKFTIQNNALDDSWERVQYFNRMVALISCTTLHFYVFTRLLIVNKCRQMNDYQILILVQSAINILACIFEILLNEIQTKNLQIVKIGHPFWQFSLTEILIITISMAVSSNITQDFLMLFNLHRLVLIKKGSLLKVYVIATPLMFFGIGADIEDSYSLVMKGQDINLFYKYGQLPVITSVILFCYIKLNKEFATNKAHSEKTKRLQRKLSTSVLLQIIILSIVSLIVNFVPWVFKKFGDSSFYTQHIVMYIIISLVITQWYSLISAILITWSITGFFQNQQNNTQTPVKILQQSEQSLKTQSVNLT